MEDELKNFLLLPSMRFTDKAMVYQGLRGVWHPLEHLSWMSVSIKNMPLPGNLFKNLVFTRIT